MWWTHTNMIHTYEYGQILAVLILRIWLIQQRPLKCTDSNCTCLNKQTNKKPKKTIQEQWHPFTFTFMHLADAFIQSDLHCIQVYSFTFDQLLLSLGIEPMILALLAPCSTIWATGKLIYIVIRISIYNYRLGLHYLGEIFNCDFSDDNCNCDFKKGLRCRAAQYGQRMCFYNVCV